MEHPVSSAEFLFRRPEVRADGFLVAVSSDGTSHVWTAEHPPRHGELFFKRARMLYEVDAGLHQVTFNLGLPSSSEAFEFQAKVDVQWRVEEPATVVRDHVRDVREVLQPGLVVAMRSVSRQFEIGDAAGAEDALNESMREGSHHAEDLGLSIRVFVQLRLDHAKRHQDRLAINMQGFLRIIERGKYAQAAAEIAENPKQLGKVLEMIRHEDDEIRAKMLEFAQYLIQSGVIERWEIDDRAKAALEWVRDSTDMVITGSGDRPELETGRRRRLRSEEREVAGPPEDDDL